MARVEEYRIELLNRYGQVIKTLTHTETNGRLTGNVNSEIRWSGEITYHGADISETQWLHMRARPVATINGTDYPLGVYVIRPSNPIDDTASTRIKLNLYDKTFIPANDAVTDTYTVPAGSRVTEVIHQLLTSTGEANVAVTHCALTLASALVWEAGTTKLRIINDLLDAIGYFSLWCDFSGEYRLDPYIPPSQRPICYTFTPSAHARHTARTERSLESKVPNRILCISQETGTTPAMRSIAINIDPTSPYSFTNQGVWITQTHTGIEAATQQILDTKAARYLARAVSSATVTRSMAASAFALNSRVSNAQGGNEIIENIDITLTPGQLMTITTREVK